MILSDILKDSNYKLTQFSKEQILRLEESIVVKDGKDKSSAYVTCLVRKKEIKLTPEEAVRQLYVLTLQEEFGYLPERMELEYAVTFGKEKKRADIVIFDKDQTTTPFIMLNLKNLNLKTAKTN
jgi:type I restriction enzyme M protein